MSKTVGALWVKEYEKDGAKHKMLSGEIDLGALGTVKIAVFKNDRKEKENQPDYRIVLSEGVGNRVENADKDTADDSDVPF